MWEWEDCHRWERCAYIVPRAYGRVGYDVPVAQSTTFRLKPYHAASDDDDDSVVDEANAYAEGSVFRSQAGVGSAVDDPGGGVDDPGGGNTDDLGSFHCDFLKIFRVVCPLLSPLL